MNPFGFLGGLLRFARARFTREQLDYAIAVVEDAKRFNDADARRTYAIAAIKAAFPSLPESVIRLLVELAVQHFKR